MEQYGSRAPLTSQRRRRTPHRVRRAGRQSRHRSPAALGRSRYRNCARAGALALAPFAEFRVEGAKGTVARLGAQLALPTSSKLESLVPGALFVRLFGEQVHLTGQERAYQLNLTVGASPMSLLPSGIAPRR